MTPERVLTDNGSAYRSRPWTQACTELAITPKKTRPYRTQTNGKVEHFHRPHTATGGKPPVTRLTNLPGQ